MMIIDRKLDDINTIIVIPINGVNDLNPCH